MVGDRARVLDRQQLFDRGYRVEAGLGELIASDRFLDAAVREREIGPLERTGPARVTQQGRARDQQQYHDGRDKSLHEVLIVLRVLKVLRVRC